MKKDYYDFFENHKNKIRKENALKGRYHFINRGKNKNNFLYILSGYKPDLWERVFQRILREDLSDFDVCLLSSGMYSESLDKYASEYGWSYIWSEQNIVSNIQNYAIECFPSASAIWKMDEDIFLCRDYFKILTDTKRKAEQEIDYEVGLVGPLIPINSYGYIRFLKRCGRFDEYERRFGISKVGGYTERLSRNLWSLEANKYIWEVTGALDDKARQFNSGLLQYSLCFGKYSIGSVMFERSLWSDMGGFERDHYLCDGRDELSILAYCALKSKAVVVAEDALVAHHSFGGIYASFRDELIFIDDLIEMR